MIKLQYIDYNFSIFKKKIKLRQKNNRTEKVEEGPGHLMAHLSTENCVQGGSVLHGCI